LLKTFPGHARKAASGPKPVFTKDERGAAAFRNLPGGQKFKALVPIIRGSDHRNLLAFVPGRGCSLISSSRNMTTTCRSIARPRSDAGETPASRLRPALQAHPEELPHPRRQVEAGERPAP
jgi:hypothetical protein